MLIIKPDGEVNQWRIFRNETTNEVEVHYEGFCPVAGCWATIAELTIDEDVIDNIRSSNLKEADMAINEVKLRSNQEYLLKEALRNEHYRMSYHLKQLSIDDYENNGHNIESDIRDLENMMFDLGIRF